MGFLRHLDRLIGYVIATGKWLVLPLIVLLFLQWPLRDLFRAYSREANDIGQWIFALYVAISVTAATRAGTHLAADVVAQRYSTRRRAQLSAFAMAFGLVPWALFILLASKDFVTNAVVGFERFPDTLNPGYFIIKIALWVMALLVLAQAVVAIVRSAHAGQR